MDLNNSDVDFCEFRGKTIITYSWGNQQGTEFLAEAVYDRVAGELPEGVLPDGPAGPPWPASGGPRPPW